jgi:hypothetical protein
VLGRQRPAGLGEQFQDQLAAGDRPLVAGGFALAVRILRGAA